MIARNAFSCNFVTLCFCALLNVQSTVFILKPLSLVKNKEEYSGLIILLSALLQEYKSVVIEIIRIKFCKIIFIIITIES